MADLGNTDFEYLKRYENNIVIVSHYEKQNNWALVKIENNSNLKDRQKFIYEVLSNKKRIRLYRKICQCKIACHSYKGRNCKALMQCYETAKDLTFIDVEILEHYSKIQQTTDCNHFIDENIRVDRFKK